MSIGAIFGEDSDHYETHRAVRSAFVPIMGSHGVDCPSPAPDIVVQFTASVTNAELCEALRDLADHVADRFPHDTFYRENVEANFERAAE